MTDQYLCGELGTRLAQLEDVGLASPLNVLVHHLRLRAEAAPPQSLCIIADRALDIADALCWCALDSGEITQFLIVASLACELFDFADSAQLLD